jgi:hypothetical protein
MMDYLILWMESNLHLKESLPPETLWSICDGVRDLLDETTLSGYLSAEEYEALEEAIRDAEWGEALRLARKGKDLWTVY